MGIKGFQYFLVILTLLFSLHSANSSTPSDSAAQSGQLEQQVDQIVATNMKLYSIPGLAIAVLQKGKPTLLKGYGYADVQSQQPVGKDTLFAIGSVSKVITAFAIMMLVQQGKINLDDSVLQYIPKAPQAWQAVTIRQLLSHSSGIPQHQGPYLPWEQIWQTMAQKPMQFTPGTGIKYNNFGYIVLDRVIENVSHQSLSDFFQNTIFQPLGMNQTGFPPTLFPAGLATGYQVNNGVIEPNPNKKPWQQMWGSGGIVSSITDMARFDAAMSAGQLLSPSSYKQLWSPTFLKNGQPAGHKDWAWALGWQVSYDHDKLVAFKNGAIRGYSSWIVRHIDDQVSIIILANTNHVPLKKIAKQVFKQVMSTQKGDQNTN
ncbi:serine hydrolase domain-containing protein [Legionella micdadei]|uniref:Beta-lactamase n=1 Tax=Legionella micdadei TaxID=451 RepID=A0A098GJ86_LEGMI|nr:serine hydrolase domain-containing protein [Legionella micdadei]ARG96561.1 serine hydrolase [Legionella micdadei]ARG99310.1 serine hydrolase [Legionella micdadei]KTD27367.1 beta-lactamase [Legionella micdadei]NSL18843.1 beta-lactamase family protein [Legionella micdadei]CEG62077.1 Beta-lactamase [Legionella micdadei]